MGLLGQPADNQAHDHQASAPDLFLIERVQLGCSECFSLLFNRYRNTVYSIAWRVLRDSAEAEDLVQEVFLSIYQRRRGYELGRGTVKTWILHDVHFKALTRRRQINGAMHDSIESDGQADPQVSSRLLSREIDTDRIHWIDRSLESLNERQRKVIQLVHFDGYTLAECSRILEESLANTRNLYYRGMKTLRESLMPANSSSRMLGNDRQESKDIRILPVKSPIMGH
jgi:RNA polymerase sigma-70 factor, ECF subfamily